MRVVLVAVVLVLAVFSGCTAVPRDIGEDQPPIVDKVFPAIATAGSSDLTLSVSGTNFRRNAKVVLNGEVLASYASAKHIFAVVKRKHLVIPQTLELSVENSPTAKSGPVPFTVEASSSGQGAEGRLGIVTDSLPVASIGSAYREPVLATGGEGPYTWSVPAGSLPSGIVLSATTGQLSGSASSTGAHTFTVQVTDAAGQESTKQLTLAVKENAPTVTTGVLPSAIIDGNYSEKLAASGGVAPYTWFVAQGSLPAGLSLGTAGQITGVPSAAGTSTFSAHVTDALGQTASRELSLTVSVKNPPAEFSSAHIWSDGFENGGKAYYFATSGAAVVSNGCRSGNYCGAMTVPADRPQQGNFWEASFANPIPSGYYYRSYFKFPVGWQFVGDYKALIFYTGEGGTHGTVYVNFQNGSTPLGRASIAAFSGDLEWRKSSGMMLADGQWHALETQLTWTNGSIGGGRIRLWLDGVPILDAPDTVFQGAGVRDIKFGAYSNAGYPSSQTFYMDDNAISSQRVGP